MIGTAIAKCIPWSLFCELETHMKILIVDDATITRVTLRMVLQKIGHEVFEAPDLAGGLALFFKQKPDYVFTDLNLAGESGLQLFSEITALYPSVPVALMTASNDKRVRKDAIASGIREVLVKPLDLNRIVALVSNHTSTCQSTPFKVSFSLDPSVLENARTLAKEKNQTVEQYIQALVTEQLKAPVPA